MGNAFRSRKRKRVPSWSKIKSNLTSSSATLTERWVALQFCRKRAPSREELGKVLIEALKFNKESVLMRHEIAFALGQTGRGVETLKKIMRDSEHEDEVTRHEAAESLSTLVNCKNDFETYAKNRDRFPILADTCALALEGMRRFLSGETDAAFAPCCGCQTHKNKEKQTSSTSQKTMTVEEEIAACAVLGDTQASLYDRYEACFELRDRHLHLDIAVKAIACALEKDTSSACFRHELAFTLGILGSPDSENILISKLDDTTEHSVVRHEAALALQCIASESAERALYRVSKIATEDIMVRESCIVALAMRSYILTDDDKDDDLAGEYIFGFGGGQ